MIRQFYYLLTFTCLFFIWSCDQPAPNQQNAHQIQTLVDIPKTPSDVLLAEVMKIHDDVMPKVKDIHRLKKQLEIQLTATNEGVDKKEVQAVYDQLEAADNSMWDWMKAYRQPNKETPQEEAIKYLEKEKITISKVSEDMLNSIAAGEKLLEKLKINKSKK